MFSKIFPALFLLQTALVLCTLANEIKEKEAAMAAGNYSFGINSIGIMGSFVDGSSTCGDTLRATTGAISYKHFENAAPNERCVWVVRAPSATAYSVTLVGLGISSSVIIQGFGYRGAVTTRIQTAASTAAFTISNSNILVITFHTGPTVSGRGFSLRYSASSTSGTTISSSSEDLVVPANAGNIKYPAGTKSTYGNLELSPFVLTPTPAASVSAGFKKTDVVYIRNALEGTNSCLDSLKVYTFDRTISATDKWRLQGEICSGVDSEVITNNDLILLLFQSDGSVVGSGFHLYSRAN